MKISIRSLAAVVVSLIIQPLGALLERGIPDEDDD